MSDDNVIVLDVLTTINLPPERILNAALEADLAAARDRRLRQEWRVLFSLIYPARRNDQLASGPMQEADY
jgi:hypothetical protein